MELIKQNDMDSYTVNNGHFNGGCFGGGSVGVANGVGKNKQRIHRSNKNGLRLTKSAGMTANSTNPLPPIVPRQKTPPNLLQVDLNIDDALGNYENMVKKSISFESKAPLGSIGGGDSCVNVSDGGKTHRRQRQAHTAPAISVSRSLQQLPPMRVQQLNENSSSLASSIDNSVGGAI